MLTTLISSNAVQAAPAGIVTATSAALKGAALGTSTSTLVKGTLDMLAWAKMKFALLAGLGLLCVAGTGILRRSCPGGINPNISTAPSARGSRNWTTASAKPPCNCAGSIGTRRPITPRPRRRRPRPFVSWEPLRSPIFLIRSRGETSWLDRLSGHGTAPALAAHRRAALALDALGPQAKPLIPQLTRFLRGDTSPKEAAIGLAAIGPEGWRVLTTSLS